MGAGKVGLVSRDPEFTDISGSGNEARQAGEAIRL